MMESPETAFGGGDEGSWHCMEEKKSAMVPKVTKGFVLCEKIEGEKKQR